MAARSYGAVVGEGIVDLAQAPQACTACSISLRAGALGEARKVAAGASPDIALKDVTLQPPVVCPEKILCIGVNYGNRHAEYKDGAEQAKYPSMFFRTPGSFVGSGEPLVKPSVTQQFDYEGEIALVIGKEGRRIAKEKAHEHIAGLHAVQRRHRARVDAALQVQRHAGQELRRVGQPRSLDGHRRRDRSRKAAAPDHEGERRAAPGRHHREPAVHLRGPLAYVTIFTTLKPGDIIVTGTPVGAGARFDPPRWLKAGDVVDISVPEIGTLSNRVVDEA